MMKNKKILNELESQHTPQAIRQRFQYGLKQSYLKDFVYGAIDGTVTTFAVVSSVAGAGLSSGIVIILGVANLLGDGFSMAVSNFLATRSEEQLREKVRKMEEKHIAHIPEGEREEIRQIFAAKGFSEKELEKVVSIITSNKKQWVDIMLQEEWGISLSGPSPFNAGFFTFLSFVLIGLLPLLAFVYQLSFHPTEFNSFFISTCMTAMAFFAVGAFKGQFVGKYWLLSGLETLTMGSSAAFLAFIIGASLKNLVS